MKATLLKKLDDSETLRFLVSGDAHKNHRYVRGLLQQAKAENPDFILFCGDFGYWEHQGPGWLYLNDVSDHALQAQIPILWIDGNHDNHPLLWDKYQCQGEKLVEIRPNVFYIPRFSVFELCGHRGLFLGGGVSIDKMYRTPGDSYWDSEMLDAQRVPEVKVLQPCNLMFGHDSWLCPDPESVKMNHPEELVFREIVREIYDHHQPMLSCWGHYHISDCRKREFSSERTGVNWFLPGDQSYRSMVCSVSLTPWDIRTELKDLGSWI